jgi:KDO2-lipid IV(A) lauroyltransferase
MAKHPLLTRRLRGVVLEHSAAQRVVWRVEALLANLFWTIASWLSPDRASRIGRAFGRWLGPRLRRDELVRQNLAFALPEASPAEIERLSREVWGSVGAVLAELPHFGYLGSPASGRIQVEVKGERALRERGRPVLFVTAHTANWQLGTAGAAQLGHELTVVYAPDSNPWIDRRLVQFRGRLPCRLIPRDGSVRILMRELAAGRSIGIVADHRRDEGELVRLFGRPTPISTVPARLALRFDCDLVPVWLERIGAEARFRMTVFDPVRPTDPTASAAEQALQMTQALADHFERWFRARPEQWICNHRQWPKPGKLREVARVAPVSPLPGDRARTPRARP